MQNILISLLNFNNFSDTKKCAQSILKSDYSNYELMIIDNSSTDNSFEMLKSTFPKITVVQSAFNGGYAAGHEIGVNYALKFKFNAVWILNNDLEVRENTLTSLVSANRKYGQGIFGSISIKRSNPEVINFGGGVTHDIYDKFDYNSYEDMMLSEYLELQKTREVQTIEGSSFLINTQIIKNFGFMNKKYFMYCEDIEYCYRMKINGIKSFVVVESVVLHEGGESMKSQSNIQQYYRRRNHLFFLRKFYNQSILMNIIKKNGLIRSVLLVLKSNFFNSKDELYYICLANIHALVRKKGKLT